MKRYSLILFSLLSALSFADSYWLQFADKKGTTGDLNAPEQYLSERAIERRLRYDIPIDSLDLPISETYIQQVTDLGATFIHGSKWLNGITVEASDEVLEQLLQLPFIQSVQRTKCDACTPNPLALQRRRQALQPTTDNTPTNTTDSEYGSAYTQINMLNLPPLHRAGYKGQNILITVVDDGFYRTDRLTAFDYVRDRIIGTRDLVQPNNSVYSQGSHGTMVLSIIAAKTDDIQGSATEASYYLIRSEDDDTESLRELDAQVAAYELADSLGSDIVTCSLGYLNAFDDPNTPMYYSELDGKTYRNSRAATIAARKGLLVLNAMGNEGGTYDTWHYLDAPADADSILSIGAVTAKGIRSSFSSWGPTADGRQKPELSAMGTSVCYIHPTTDQVTTGSGTSFSTPLIAGAVASLWSALPQETNMQIITRLIQNSSQYHNPDYGIGYGIPDLYAAYQQTPADLPTLLRENDLQPILRIYDIHGNNLGNDLTPLPQGFYIVLTPTGSHKLIIQ